ncbi:MAG TPA: T9SS type A sorting domain-containing protein [Candidatus Handelsmanbacteria bacterium]|nr:T9SS type A sorting domain-containing protein [Candidatus Handelsmanbacteria bacterium]
MRLHALLWLAASLAIGALAAGAEFRVLPYLQNPATDAITVVWFSADNTPGILTVVTDTGVAVTERVSEAEVATALTYPTWEAQRFFDGQPPAPPFVHRERLTGLQPRQSYRYQVQQGAVIADGRFTTAPLPGRGPVRLIFFADCETEPESTGKHTPWPDPTQVGSTRKYLLDQTTGFANNLRVILEREPDLLAIAGDVVESGGEQRDWDEFWKHLGNVDGTNLAGRIPLLAAPGNHEYYEGPSMGKYNQPGSERAVGRFRVYFAGLPDNGTDARGRYYRLDYGPVTLIALDVTNGSPNRSDKDTNFFLLGGDDAGGGRSPGFAPGSEQYRWLESQLADAREHSAFTFVFFHHVPYSVGPHGWPPGTGDGLDEQSGVPVRQLTPLFMRYGVDALFAGHDEIWERSQIDGVERLADGSERSHTLQVYDVGIAGDGLRGPEQGLENPHQRFTAHIDAPEIWVDGILQSGGKHYGHLEVDVLDTKDGRWQAVLKPVYVFPLLDQNGQLIAFERRLYADVVTLTSEGRATVISKAWDFLGSLFHLPGNGFEEELFGFEPAFPNPFNSSVLVRFRIEAEAAVSIDIYDVTGQHVRRLLNESYSAGNHAVEWDGRAGDGGDAVASGVYLLRLESGTLRDTVEVTLVR